MNLFVHIHICCDKFARGLHSAIEEINILIWPQDAGRKADEASLFLALNPTHLCQWSSNM
jgi:hypothetical protein